ncbi:MAG: hypothetical protein O2894_12600 [Planctomycetota bacterium]|nr:hypothetical protein [Planctomycetota bacterium]
MNSVRTLMIVALLVVGSAVLVGCCCDPQPNPCEQPNPCDPCGAGAAAPAAPAAAPAGAGAGCGGGKACG